MSSYRQETDVFLVTTEIGESSPTEVRIDIDRSPYVLGRSPVSDMKFDEDHVSRKHATVEIVEEKVCLVDQSTAGTWVNGVPLVRKQPFPLMVGDRINLGTEHTVLQVGGEGEGDTRGRLLLRNPAPELELDIGARAVFKNGFGTRQPLSQTEFDMLSEMYLHPDQVITFEKIWRIIVIAEPISDGDEHISQQALNERARRDLEEMPEDQFGLTRGDRQRIRQRISDLRKKIERLPGKPVIVLNSAGAGYKMPRFKFLDTPPYDCVDLEVNAEGNEVNVKVPGRFMLRPGT